MIMADSRDRRGCDGPLVESLPCGGASDTAATARRHVFRYGKCLAGRTARKQFPDCIRHAGAQIAVLFNTAHLLAPAPSRSRACFLNAFVFSFLECRFFDQDALAFVMARALLYRTTTAESVLCFLARRVSAASPRGR